MNRQSFGLWELLLLTVLAIGVYALIARHVRKPEAKAPAPEPAVAAPEPEIEPPPEPAPAPEPEVAEPAPPAPEPEQLGLDDIEAAMRTARPAIDGCHRRHPASGTVWVDVEVAPSGRVTRVTVGETPDDGLGRCVATALRKLKLPKTEATSTFSVPISFE